MLYLKNLSHDLKVSVIGISEYLKKRIGTCTWSLKSGIGAFYVAFLSYHRPKQAFHPCGQPLLKRNCFFFPQVSASNYFLAYLCFDSFSRETTRLHLLIKIKNQWNTLVKQIF